MTGLNFADLQSFACYSTIKHWVGGQRYTQQSVASQFWYFFSRPRHTDHTPSRSAKQLNRNHNAYPPMRTHIPEVHCMQRGAAKHVRSDTWVLTVQRREIYWPSILKNMSLLSVYLKIMEKYYSKLFTSCIYLHFPSQNSQRRPT